MARKKSTPKKFTPKNSAPIKDPPVIRPYHSKLKADRKAKVAEWEQAKAAFEQANPGQNYTVKAPPPHRKLKAGSKLLNFHRSIFYVN
jgi:hypothetical protein